MSELSRKTQFAELTDLLKYDSDGDKWVVLYKAEEIFDELEVEIKELEKNRDWFKGISDEMQATIGNLKYTNITLQQELANATNRIALFTNLNKEIEKSIDEADQDVEKLEAMLDDTIINSRKDALTIKLLKDEVKVLNDQLENCTDAVALANKAVALANKGEFTIDEGEFAIYVVDLFHARQAADEIGFPVVIVASGCKDVIVKNPTELHTLVNDMLMLSATGEIGLKKAPEEDEITLLTKLGYIEIGGEDDKTIYNIHYSNQGVAIMYSDQSGHNYYPTFEECINAEYDILVDNFDNLKPTTAEGFDVLCRNIYESYHDAEYVGTFEPSLDDSKLLLVLAIVIKKSAVVFRVAGQEDMYDAMREYIAKYGGEVGNE